MILGLRTDSETAEIWLDGEKREWASGREMAQRLLGKIAEMLPEEDFGKITGIVVYKGGGSFTGLRIGATIANTLADALGVSIVGTTGEGWYNEGRKRLADRENDGLVLPEYGRGANITLPKGKRDSCQTQPRK